MPQRRSLFNMIFGNKVQNVNKYETLQLLNGQVAQWTSAGGLYDNAQVRACIDAIARNGAKLNPKHIRYENDADGNETIKHINGRVQRLISKRPNELMNAYDFYYKIISELYLHNNAFVYISRDEKGMPLGLYPIRSGFYQLLEYKGDVYIQFRFNNGNTHTASLKDDVIHLKRFYCENDILGGNNIPIEKVMSLKHIINEGIINAIKTTQGIKGILKSTKAMLKPEDIKKTRDTFVNDFVSSESGIAGLDATTDFKEVNINPQTATDGQVNRVDDEVMNYFGISKYILQSNYDEGKFTAFYESVLEPLALALSLEFTNKIFTSNERWHGNEIIFEANRLNFASNTTKSNLVKVLLYYGCITKNEAREIFNLVPVADGNVFPQSLATNIEEEGVQEDEREKN